MDLLLWENLQIYMKVLIMMSWVVSQIKLGKYNRLICYNSWYRLIMHIFIVKISAVFHTFIYNSVSTTWFYDLLPWHSNQDHQGCFPIIIMGQICKHLFMKHTFMIPSMRQIFTPVRLSVMLEALHSDVIGDCEPLWHNSGLWHF